jgi:hypothetical protein
MQTLINMPPQLCGAQCAFPPLSLEMLLKEPCLFSCSEEGVKEKGGVLARTALFHILNCYPQDIYNAKQEGLSAIVDVRIHRLFTGMYPAIPGWHCDAVPRSRLTGQPRFENINPRAFHVALTLSNEQAGVSNTEFVTDVIRTKIWDDNHVYKDLHEQVEHLKPKTQHISDGRFVKFWPKTIHRASPSERRGVRMFFRFSMYHNPPIVNVVDGVQQVYLLKESNGW